MKINGGATLWARQTIDSDVFYKKPHVWFKIWFYLINEANHKDNKQFKRGSCFMKYKWIMLQTKAKKNEIDHCIRWLKSATMIATAKATGGFTVEILNYNTFQSLESYKKRHEKRQQKRIKSDTEAIPYNKNDKNDKNKNDITKVISVGLKPNYVMIINYLNEKTGRNYSPKNKSTVDLLRARFNEGRTVKDFQDVIDKKVKDWLTDDKMNTYLRPSTLFNRTKFENYLNEPKKDKFDKYLEKE